MKKYLILALLLCTFRLTQGFTPVADSLLKAGINADSDEARLNALLLFCEEYRTFSYDYLKKYSQQCIELSKKLNDKKKLLRSYYYLGLYYYKMSDKDSTLHYVDLIKNMAESESNMDDILLDADCLLVALLIKNGQFKIAISNSFKHLSRSEQQKDTSGIIKSLNSIGWARFEMDQHDEAKKWFLKALTYNRSERYNKEVIVVYSNLAPCYGALGNLDSARIAVEKSIELSRRYNDLSSLANSLNTRANIDLELKKFDKAIQYVKQSIEIRKQIGDPYFIISDFAQLSYLYSRIGNFQEGIAQALKGLEMAEESNLSSKNYLLYNALFENYYGQKDYKNSTETLLKMLSLKDTMYKQATAVSLVEMEVKYETAQKENTIQQQQFLLEKKNYWLYGSISMMVLGLLLGIVAYRSYRHKQQVKIQKLQLQQQTVLTASILQAEENERRRFAADLHDGLGQILTAARYNLSGIADERHWNEEDKAVLDKTIALINEGCKEVRTVSHNILPTALLKNGLSHAVKDFIDRIDQKKITVNFSATGLEEKLPTQTEVIIYRMIQEAVNNVIKHAHATKLDISLILDASGFSMSIEDNGVGFNLDQVGKTKGMGLKSIKTRTAYLKGCLEIDTRPGKGTLISLHIPPDEMLPA